MIAVDHNTVFQFLSEIHKHAALACEGLDNPGLLQLSRIHPTSERLQSVGRFRIGDVEEMANAAIADAEAGFNVYLEGRTVLAQASGRGTDNGTRAVFALIIDRDAYSDKAGVEFINPTLRVETSPGSFHDWYCLSKAISATDAGELGRALRAAVGADSATGKPSQPYRVAGTPNLPNAKKIAVGREACATVFANGGPARQADELWASLPEPSLQPESSIDTASATGEMSERVERMLSRPAAEVRDRSEQFYAAVTAAVEDGMTFADLEALCREYPGGCSQKYLQPTDRLRDEIARIWAPHSADVAARDRLGASLVDELLLVVPPVANLDGIVFDGSAGIEPLPELIKNTLPKEGIAFIGGQSGAGKSFLATSIAVSLASDVPFFGRAVRERVGVLIVAAEGAGGVQKRIAAARSALRLEPLPIASMALSANLFDNRELAQLIARVVAVNGHMQSSYGVRLGAVIIDTVAASFVLGKGDPNGEAAAACNRMRRIGEAIGGLVLPVHHYGKDETTGLLGASNWRGSADVVLSVLADRNQVTGEVRNRSLALAKDREGREGPIAPFELEFVALGQDDDGEAYGSMHVVPRLGEPISARAARMKREPRHITALRLAFQEALGAEGQAQAVMGDGPMVQAVAIEALRVRFRSRFVTGEKDAAKASSTVRSAFSRALSAAETIGLCTGMWGDNEWVWSRDSSHVASVAAVAN